jgi:hypothetical protein
MPWVSLNFCKVQDETGWGERETESCVELGTSKTMSSSPSGLDILNKAPEDNVVTSSPNDQTLITPVLFWLLYGMNQKLKVAPSPPFREP